MRAFAGSPLHAALQPGLTCVYGLDQLKALKFAGLAYCCQLLQDVRLHLGVLAQLLRSRQGMQNRPKLGIAHSLHGCFAAV